MKPKVKKLRLSNLSLGEIRYLIERKDSANTQKVTKNNDASPFVFPMEVSAEE